MMVQVEVDERICWRNTTINNFSTSKGKVTAVGGDGIGDDIGDGSRGMGDGKVMPMATTAMTMDSR